MARNSVVAALLVMAVIVGFASAQGPSAAPAYAPGKSTIAAAPTKASPAPIAAAPERSTITAAPTTSTAAPVSSAFSDIASPPAPGSEAAEGPTGDFSTLAPIADTPAESPQSAGAALKVSPIVGVAAVVGSLLF